MRFSAAWFKKLFSFASKREKTSLTDEADLSHEKIVTEAEEVIEKPSLHKRLMGMFRRGKTGLPVESESAGQDKPHAEPETEVQPEIEAAAPIDEAGKDGGEVEALPKPGVFARLMGVFRRRKKASEAEAAGEEDAGQIVEKTGQVAEKKGDEQPGTEEAPKKGLWTRLRAVFSRKFSKRSAADLADAGELFSWSEGQAAAPMVEKAAKAEKDKKDEKGDSKSTDNKSSIEEEEQPAPGFGARIGPLLRNKKVWILLLLLLVTIGMLVFAVSFTLYKWRAREHVQVLELEKKNKRLQEENKKLQAPKKQTVTQPPKVPEAPSQNNRAGNPGASKGNDSTDDCTVSNKANAAEVLKRCIDSLNAMDRH